MKNKTPEGCCPKNGKTSKARYPMVNVDAATPAPKKSPVKTAAPTKKMARQLSMKETMYGKVHGLETWDSNNHDLTFMNALTKGQELKVDRIVWCQTLPKGANFVAQGNNMQENWVLNRKWGTQAKLPHRKKHQTHLQR